MKSRHSRLEVSSAKASSNGVRGAVPGSPRRIFIVEDCAVLREGLTEILNEEKDLAVCGEAGTAEEALRAIGRLKPDLVLVDISLPGTSGPELIRELRAADPNIKMLAVSMHDEALYADRVLRAGGDGYIMKQEDPEEIMHAIRDVLGGHIYVSEAVMAGTRGASGKPGRDAKSSPIDQLTHSELEILRLLGWGRSNREIARELRLSPPTVTAHCKALRRKLNLKNLNQLIRYAVCLVEESASQAGSPAPPPGPAR